MVTASLLVFYAVLYLISSSVFLAGFSKLERQEMQRHIARAREVVNGMLTAQARHVRDWANWDDTCAFVDDRDPEYVRTNLPDATFRDLDMDLFVFFRRDGSLFAGFQHGGNGQVIAPSAACVAALGASRTFARAARQEGEASGVLTVQERPMLVVAAPILNSEGEGPSHGTLLMGRFLTTERLRQAGKSAGLNLALVPEATGLPLSPDKPTLVRVEDHDALAGYLLFADKQGRAVARLRVDAGRWIYRQGRASQRYLMANLAAAGVMFVIVLLVLLHRLVLARLIRLDRGVARIRDAGEPGFRLPVEGNDELDQLAATINDTLDRLQEAQQTLRHDALHDPLTGLANRLLFFRKVAAAIHEQPPRPEATFAVLLIDIDHFKLINDSYGHGAGDDLLVRTAERLGQSVRPGDTVARLGGDEFAVLLDPVTADAEAVALAKKLLQNLCKPVVWNNHALHLGASIGITVCDAPQVTAEQLFRDADTAMYVAKRNGRNGLALFDHSMRERMVTDLTLQNELREAAGRGELCLYYQPIMALESGEVAGFEALIRWNHPRRGLLTPDRFMPLAESGGFVAEIDTWVFREACRCIRHWQDLFTTRPPLRVSVNLSCMHTRLLQVLTELGRILDETGIDGRCLGLEITESALAVAERDIIEQLWQIKELGVRLYLDDFGTGHSSLSRLHHLPIDVLKVDRSFTADIETVNGEIAHTIVTLAHGLGMQVVAEGIENAAQLAMLRDDGCDFGQGYLFAPALAEEHVLRWLQNQRGTTMADYLHGSADLKP
jgi:diguanylate cyclase (GGDEF)-like protein